ncbi:hypothetical protein [Geomonas oryzae]|uniref:hypothetical protein n=1 Tax=Geomonas oryzae TaxID=2364273 RepID=UPI00100A47DA|nr:hypothetical protein [Geomonas oryzae]
MWPKLIFFVFLVLFPVAIVLGQDDKPATPDDPNANVATAKPAEPAKSAEPTKAAEPAKAAEPGDEPKMVSGMSVLGNKEAPMSLFIVPWKVSELGAETSLTRTLNERPAPVDREVFRREVAFYEVSTGKTDVPAGSGAP